VKLKVELTPTEEGGYFVEVPALPGCLSQGDSIEEAQAMIRAAAELWLAAASERHVRQPDAQLAEIEL
jgi:predicted RNase H-like HicB family nuclease